MVIAAQRLFEQIAHRRVVRRDLNRLMEFDDRQLADIGLNRGALLLSFATGGCRVIATSASASQPVVLLDWGGEATAFPSETNRDHGHGSFEAAAGNDIRSLKSTVKPGTQAGSGEGRSG